MIYIKITLTIRYLHIDIHVNTYAYIESHTLALKHKTIIYAKRQENYAVGYKSINVNWFFFGRTSDCTTKELSVLQGLRREDTQKLIELYYILLPRFTQRLLIRCQAL